MSRKRLETLRRLKARKSRLRKAKTFQLRLASRRQQRYKTTTTPPAPR